MESSSSSSFQSLGSSEYAISHLDRFNLFILRPFLAASFVLSFILLGWVLAWKLVLVHVPLVQEIFGLRNKPRKSKPQTGRLSRFYSNINARDPASGWCTIAFIIFLINMHIEGACGLNSMFSCCLYMLPLPTPFHALLLIPKFVPTLYRDMLFSYLEIDLLICYVICFGFRSWQPDCHVKRLTYPDSMFFLHVSTILRCSATMPSE